MQALSRFGSTRTVLSCALLLASPLPLLAAQIGGRVYLDGNRNALLNPGEPGMATITIRLTYAGPDGNFATTGDNQTTTQVTDASGNYNFTGLAAGNYRADLDDTTLPVGLAVTAGGDPLTFNGVTAAQAITTASYALVSSGLNLTLWAVNEADPGTALPGSGSGSPRLCCFTDYTDHTGAHNFLDYGRLVWRDSNGVIQTFSGGDETNAESLAIDTRNGDAYVVVNPATGGFTVPVLFKVNLYSLRANAAQVVLTRIGEVRDAGGVAATSIEGIAFDEPNNLIYAVNTEGNTATDPERLLQIDPATAQWSSRGLIQGTAGGIPYALTYTDGLEVVPAFNGAGQVVGGTFFGYDQEDNHLYQVNPSDGAITALVNTVPDANTDIETIAWDEQAGRMISLDNGLFQIGIIPLNGSAPVLLSNYTQLGLASSASVNDLEGAGFFLRGAFPLAAIGNHVWVDGNGNGHWDEGEQPVSGVTVQLFFDSNNDGDFADAGEDTPYAATTTNAQGFYDFPGLQAGRFRVGLPPSNFSAGQPLAMWPMSSPVTNSADDRVDADDNGIQTAAGQMVFSPAIVLAEGELDHTVDFGMIGADYGDAPASYPVLLANNGAWHSAVGPTLGPVRDADLDGQPSAAANGDGADDDAVTLSSLQAGVSNSITVDSSASALLDAWVDWNRDGDWDDAGEQVATSYALTAGSNTVAIDAPIDAAPGVSYARFRISTAGGLSPDGGAADGEVEDYQVAILTTGTIAGFVREDVDNNDTGDTGIEDVLLTLLDSSGAPVDGNPGLGGVQPVTATTDANGAYAFSGLIPGTYGVAETQPGGFFSVNDSDGGNPDQIRPIVVTPGGASGGNDFVEERPGTITGSVLLDLNNDDGGDSGIGDVAVDLYSDPDGNGDPADGVLVASTTSAPGTGVFTFSDLSPGAYVLIETHPEGYYTATDADRTVPGDDAPNASALDDLIPVAVAGGETDDGNEFIEELPGTIAGRVLKDIDHDGAGDVPLDSVTIELYSDPDGDGDPADGVFVDSTQTISTGDYYFYDLAPGSYIVLESQPENHFTVTDHDVTLPGDDAANTSAVDDLIPVALGGGEVDDGNEFIEESPGSISGRVLLDIDNDNTGDISMDGVTVALFSDPDADGDPADGELLGSTQTDLLGIFEFPDMAPGSYVLVETQPENYFTVKDGDITSPADDRPNISTVDNLIPVAVAGGEIDDGNEFVEERPGSITGRVQQDLNNDGTGDLPLPDVIVSLFSDPNGDGDPEDGALLATTLSSEVLGDFSFTNRAPGSYVLLETQPENFYSATDGDTTFPGDDAPNLSTADNLIPVTIGGGEDDDGNNFVEESPGSISGEVGLDITNDGLGDQPLEGVIVSIYSDPNGDGDAEDGVLVDDTVTDAFGYYEFAILQPGDYVIVETQPDGYFTAGDSSSLFDLNDAANLSPSDNRIPANVRAGELDSGNLFAEELPGTISGYAGVDLTNDGISDQPLEGVTVSLFSDPNGDGDAEDGVQIDDILTDAAGYFEFTALQQGNYVIVETQPAGYFTASDSSTPFDPEDVPNISTVDNLIPAFLRPGEIDSGNRFAEELPGTISGYAGVDLTNDDISDQPLEGVTVSLYSDPNGDGDAEDGILIGSTLTDALGFYEFTALQSGSYVIVETQPEGYFTASDSGFVFDPGDAPNLSPVDNFIPATIRPGEDDSDNRFVEELPGSISGFVSEDTDGDGFGNVPLESVTVTLYSDPDGDGDPADGAYIGDTLTDETGFYQFTGLPSGDYAVQESQPAGYFSLRDGSVLPEEGDAPNVSATDNLIPVSILPGENDSLNDFVEALPGSLSGSVLADADNDDTGDTAIVNVELLLVDDSGNAVDSEPETPGIQLTTTLTDEEGFYSFSNLAPGVYGVVEMQPAGYLSVGDTDGDDPDFIYLITVLPSQNTPGNNFVEELPGSFSGRVLADDNNDDAGDTGIEGVTITLLDFTGNPLDGDSETPGVQYVTNLTAPDGTYSFTDLPPGIYGVAETHPDGFLSVTDRDGGNPNSIHPVTVTAAQDNPDNDFIEELPVAIGNFIYADTNANGYHDGGETGVPPVLVQLLFDANNDGDLDDPGESTPVQTVLAVGGIYNFTNLPPGNYQAVIPVPPAGYALSSPNRSTADDGQDSDNNGIQTVAGGPTHSPVINLLAGTEPDVETDNSDNSTDSSVDFAFTPLKATNWVAWQNLNPLGGQNNPNENPDGDLSDNLIEFAFCYDPRNGVPQNPRGQRGFCLLQNGTGGFYAEVIRPTGFTGLSYTLEYTAELSGSTAWSSNDDADGITPVITSVGGGFESVRWDNLEGIPALSDGHGFVRIRVEELDLELQAWTEVQGWLDHRIEFQCETCSNPFLKKEVFSGTGDDGSPLNAIDVSGSGTSVNVASLLTGKTGLYVEVLHGPYEGHRFAVNPAASDADTIALLPGDPLNTVSPIPDLSGAPIVVRESWRFAELFPASVFRSGGDLNNADNILTFNAATQSWSTYFLADLGGFGTYWVNSADFTGPPPVNQNNVTFGPSQGFFFHRRGPAVTLPLMGIVRENDFRCPLALGNNLTGGGYPLDQSYSSRGMTLDANAGFTGNADIRKADQVLFWRGDRVPGLISYDTFFFLNAGAPYQYWVSAGDNFVTSVDASPDFKAGRAAFIKRTALLGTYTIRAPWSPAPER